MATTDDDPNREVSIEAAAPLVRTLLVDDEQLVRELLRTRLEDEGFDVVDEAADAKSAIALAALHEPDLIILDHHMPGMPGVDIIPALVDASPTATLVVYTANDSASVSQEAARLGAVAVVDKADGPTALLAVVRRVCRSP